MFNIRVVTLGAALLLAVASCNNNASPTGEAAQESMGLYAKGFNALINNPKQMITEYFKRVPERGPNPTSKEKIQLFPRHRFAATDIKVAKEAFAQAKTAAPESLKSLGPTADAAIAAIERVEKTFEAAHAYYDAENYKDDNFAKGKELHAQMVTAANDFEGALDKLASGLSAIEDVQTTADLKKLDDKSYGYWFRFYNAAAKKFLSAVEGVDSAAELGKLEAAFASITKAFEGLEAFAKSKGDKIQATFDSYVDSARTFHSTGMKIVRLARAGKDVEAFRREADALLSSYNTLVSLENSLLQLEGNNLLK